MNEVKELKTYDATASIVIPVFNSETALPELAERLDRTLRPLLKAYEIIFVNDGSRDNSWNVISQLAAEKSHVRGFNLMTNYGQHNALLAGVNAAQYDIIMTVDDDLQHPPEEIPRLLEMLWSGYDVVYGRPVERSHSAWRNFSSKLLKTTLKVVLGAEMGGHSSAFRAFRADLRKGFEGFRDAQLSIDVLLSWSAARVTHVLVEHHSRKIGKSGYTMRKLMLLAFNMLTGYSTLPLRVASGVGLLTALYGFALFFYVVIRRLVQTNYVPGFTFIAAEIALFAGLQLFAIGVIGEYIARLHFRTMGKPPYVVREAVNLLPQTKNSNKEQKI